MQASWIRVSFIDVFGTLNSLHVPGARWADAVANGIIFDGSALEGRARIFESDMLLRPVPETLVATDGVGRAIGQVLTTDGTPWAGDPRTCLRLAVDRVEEVVPRWRAMAELEFYLVDSAGIPADQSFYFGGVEGVGLTTVRHAADQLAAHGVQVQSVHHEAGPGQYEIDIAPLGAMQLADALMLAKQLVRESSEHHGLQVTFMARPFDGEPGSGLHLHQQTDRPLVDAAGDLTAIGRSFLGGQLRHAGALCALASPTVNSYKRLHASGEAPASAMWSHRHRGSLIRVSPKGIEFRGADPSTNPYLCIAGLLITGADGVVNDEEPPRPDDESIGGFDATGESARFEPLPRTLDDALDCFLADDVLLDAFDDGLVERLLVGRRTESAEYRQHVTDWERRRYFETA
ncbi:MAG: glutamine synthetase catalytic region [Ilumatobacteraceae bacterium]|nr:glutamine synthetase catalytic region [Ilumatobacteraceae bacterium]